MEMQMQLVTVQQASWLPLIARIVLTSQVGSHSFPSVASFSQDFQPLRVTTRVSLNNIRNDTETGPFRLKRMYASTIDPVASILENDQHR